MGGFLSSLFGGGNVNWLHNGMAGILGNLNNVQQGGMQGFYNLAPSVYGPSANFLPSASQDYSSYLLGGNGQQGLMNSVGSEGNSFLGNGSQLNSLMGGLLGGGAQQLGNSISAGVGQEGQLGAFQNGALQSMADTNSPGVAGQILDALTYNAPGQYQQGFGAAGNMLGTGGFAPGISGGAQQASNLFGNGGLTPLLQSILGPLSGIVGAGGNNAQSEALLGGGAPFLQSGGQTGLTQGLQQQGMNLFDQQALMNPAQAAGLAGNLASTAAQSQAKQAEANALARGGGAGATVANGMQNQGMADFANQISQQTSGAETGALQNQQALQLQQQLGGAQAAQGGGNLQNAFLGTGGSLAGQSGTLANNLLATALGLTPTTQNAATGALNAGTGIGQLAQGGYLGAGNLLNSLAGTQSQEAQGMGNLQNNIAQGFGGLTNQSMSNQNNLLNNVMNAGLGTGQLGTGQFSALTGAQNNLGNLLGNQYNNYMNPLISLLGQYSGLVNSSGQSQANLFGGSAAGAAAQQNPGVSNILGILSTLSSIRYKQNVAPVEHEIDDLNKLQAVTYEYNGETEKQYGFIAEDVNELYPELVFKNEDGQVEGIHYSKIIPLLLAKIQKLEKRLEKVENPWPDESINNL